MRSAFSYIASTLDGCIHEISPIKTATVSKTKYFDMKVQTSDENAVRVVCFSPEKRVNLQQCQSKQTPVSITEICRNEKRLGSFDEYTMLKSQRLVQQRWILASIVMSVTGFIQ